MIDEAVEAIRSGQLIGIPTDTVYGIGADPFVEDPVAELFRLKRRTTNSPVGLLVCDLDQAWDLAQLSAKAIDLAEMHWPGALTLVVKSTRRLASGVGDGPSHTVGLRMPDHEIALALLEASGPLAVSSANLSGERESRSDVEAKHVFGDALAIYVVGVCPGGEASTVVDVTGLEPRVLRKGPVAV